MPRANAHHRHGETAGHLCVANIPRMVESTTVREAFDVLRRERFDSVELINRDLVVGVSALVLM